MFTNSPDRDKSVDSPVYGRPGELTSNARTKRALRTSWFILSYLLVFLVGMLFARLLDISFNNSNNQAPAAQATAPQKDYPGLLVSTPVATPEAGLPYNARTVFNAFLAKGMKMNDIVDGYNWTCCVTYQPEGHIVAWEEVYGQVLEIATFANSAEVKADATNLLKSTSGYLISTHNLCLFFYDNTVPQAHLAAYNVVISAVCK